ncbi:hypothetical protein B0T18DRAFT_425655 [Schizothecium vesticola]|uniref:Uncharacterized protein n=1 Tax=Schizothecium vesticola TaxID=314040 RepID=A0AA40K9L0_9PEZI|nr:hypothetical protein B0T18DRAFT_425655 [Schizothecium vesticola]
MPPTYRSNTPAPPKQSMHRPPPPGPTQPPPANTAPPTTKPSNSAPTPKKPHAQNLFVDVAETVERYFPYKDVAARHGVPPAKVAEALSGVVLLPLLRCASDKRRAGKLAHDRMREYRDVRGALQHQQGVLLPLSDTNAASSSRTRLISLSLRTINRASTSASSAANASWPATLAATSRWALMESMRASYLSLMRRRACGGWQGAQVSGMVLVVAFRGLIVVGVGMGFGGVGRGTQERQEWERRWPQRRR